MPVALFESVGPCCYEFEKAGVFSEDCLSAASSAAASFFKFVMADSNRVTGITRIFGTLSRVKFRIGSELIPQGVVCGVKEMSLINLHILDVFFART